MLNWIWAGMLAVGIIAAALSGKNMEQITAAAFSGADNAITLALGLAGALMLWSGLMKLAEQSGLTKIIAKILAPVLHRLLPGVAKDSPAMSAVVMNVSANFLGLGNAATPFGLKAMEELQRINPRSDRASDAMISFLILNTSSITLIPALVISLRLQAGSANPGEIILPAVCAALGGLIFGLILHKCLSRWF